MSEKADELQGGEKRVEDKNSCDNTTKRLRIKLNNVLSHTCGLADILTPLITILVRGTLLIQFFIAYYLVGAVGIPLLAITYIIPLLIREHNDEKRRLKMILGAR